ncbi:MAG: 2-oxoacid:acceptor oxidoreductase subunit alpha [Candidatus Thermoplasmatota archaeon]|nr:2-oxoacid:acceptor oxidoreductase subunit alpha [Candidatus Thermoplasmatota archaeon]
MVERFISGNVACAEGALKAGCRFFAGYPITPSTEIAEHMALELPKYDGIFIQMEDELASMAAILGASAAGTKSMTATSGPGFSLMMENLGLGIMMELPCVLVNIQRAGPSTGLPTLAAQGDMMQARWGSHGSYEIIALTPSSPQELYDLTIRAFNLAEEYSTPVLVMSDEIVGHMCERVSLHSEIEIKNRKIPSRPKAKYRIYETGEDLIPTIPNAGAGYRIHLTGLTHDERGYPAIDAETQERLVKRLNDKITKNAASLVRVEQLFTDDAEVIVVAYGITARIAAAAVREARNNNIKAGLVRLITVWPFPDSVLKELASREKLRSLIVPELNYGQIYYEVERCSRGKSTTLVPKMGGEAHTCNEIYSAIKKSVSK